MKILSDAANLVCWSSLVTRQPNVRSWYMLQNGEHRHALSTESGTQIFLPKL